MSKFTEIFFQFQNYFVDRKKQFFFSNHYIDVKFYQESIYDGFCPEGAFCVGRAKKIDVRTSVPVRAPVSVRVRIVSRSICQKQICGKV